MFGYDLFLLYCERESGVGVLDLQVFVLFLGFCDYRGFYNEVFFLYCSLLLLFLNSCFFIVMS